MVVSVIGIISCFNYTYGVIKVYKICQSLSVFLRHQSKLLPSIEEKKVLTTARKISLPPGENSAYRVRKNLLTVSRKKSLPRLVKTSYRVHTNFSYDSINCFTLILIGEPHLNRILEAPIHEALRQRITVHYDYNGLSNDEVKDYIFHKFKIANASTAILGEGVFASILGHCQGNPRLIDNLMTEALTLGAQAQKEILDTEIIMAAINNQTL